MLSVCESIKTCSTQAQQIAQTKTMHHTENSFSKTKKYPRELQSLPRNTNQPLNEHKSDQNKHTARQTSSRSKQKRRIIRGNGLYIRAGADQEGAVTKDFVRASGSTQISLHSKYSNAVAKRRIIIR